MGSTEESTLPTRLPTMLHPDWNRLKESTVPRMMTQVMSRMSLPLNCTPWMCQGRKNSSITTPPMVMPQPVMVSTWYFCISFRGETV